MKSILAISMGVILAVSLAAILSYNALAVHPDPNEELQKRILALTELIKGQTRTVNANLDNINYDLQFKQKFWTLRNDTLVDIFDIEILGICEDGEGNETVPDDACTFNLESLQLGPGSSGCIEFVGSTGLDLFSNATDFSGKEVCGPANFLVDWGLGNIGALPILDLPGTSEISVICSVNNLCNGPFEANGEKPQGMMLIPIYLSLNAGSVGIDVSEATGSVTVSSVDQLVDVLEDRAGETGKLAGMKIAENLCSEFPFLEGC
jgi:hypothetical protein